MIYYERWKQLSCLILFLRFFNYFCIFFFLLQYTTLFKSLASVIFYLFFKIFIFLFRRDVLESHNKDLYC